MGLAFVNVFVLICYTDFTRVAIGEQSCDEYTCGSEKETHEHRVNHEVPLGSADR